MKIGTEDKKKLGALGALFLVLGYLLYSNVFSSPSSAPPSAARTNPVAAAPPALASPAIDTPSRPAASRAPNRNRSDEFLPKLRSKRPEDQIDPNTVDPTLRLDLLAKLQEVGPAGSGRNLFTMGPPPPPPAPPKPVGPEPKIALGHGFIGPTAIYIPPPPPPAPPPPLPAITFKYYGFSTVRKDGKKAAFFLSMSGEEIFIKAVGDMVDQNYKLLSIGLTSAVVEDKQSKRTQTVPLAEEAQS
jgi:hypothetical protein